MTPEPANSVYRTVLAKDGTYAVEAKADRETPAHHFRFQNGRRSKSLDRGARDGSFWQNREMTVGRGSVPMAYEPLEDPQQAHQPL